MTAYTINLLGPFSVTDPAGESARFRSDKVRALLAYLLVEADTPQHREQLMALLWPRVAERSARESLRSGLYHLRRALPNHKTGADIEAIIHTRGQYVELNRTYGYVADVEQFLNGLEAAQARRGTDWPFADDYRELLKSAVAHYGGAFLSTLAIDDSGAFEEWSQLQRVRFRTKMLDALSDLATIALRRSEYAEAEAYVRQQIALDNLRESAYQQQMEILARSGREAEAGRVYEELARLLRAELGMSPGSQTTTLLEQIRGGELMHDRASQLQVRGYQLKEKKGEGAFGSVFQATQAVVGRSVAIKVIKPEHARRPAFIRRFEAEAQLVARLEHPHIVPLYDYWREPEGAYLVMRWLGGGDLEAQLGKRQAEVDYFLQLSIEIAGALHYAHAHGVIHRDLKPANILLDEEGHAYLSDFGIAKDMLREVELTQQESMAGSPAYISPEQILNEPVTPQTDIYTFGVVLFELLTGQKPFRGASVATMIYKHVNEALPSVHELRPDLPAGIDDIILRATAKNPLDRYETPLQLVNALSTLLGQAGMSDQPLTAVDPQQIGRNPYRGLRAFQEADAHLFCGRAALVERLIGRMHSETVRETTGADRFMTIIGPSGSGKSSVVKAGLLPALRGGALPHSDAWFITEMVPGTHPLEELETALRRILSDAPTDLLTPLQRDERGLIRVLRHSLPPGDDGRPGQILLLIDQFEELFTLVTGEARRQFFIDSLLAALNDPRSQLRVVVTLRADFYDRPLQYGELGDIMRQQTEVILPLNATELAEAIRIPAARAGVTLQDGLIPAILSDLSDQSGALPLLQYALTELFERRHNNRLTLAAYKEIGGVSGAIGQRAEEIFAAVPPDQQELVRQLLLRLITLGEGSEDTRRRVLQAEISGALAQLESVTASQVTPLIERFGRHRLLTFDHDPVTRGPTVEVAHEALIREWPRLREWLEDSRDDIRRQRRLAQAAAEWEGSDRDDSFLWRGANLEQYAGWADITTIALTSQEERFLHSSLAARDARAAAEEARRQRELEQAQQLAETEHRRAEEQSAAAARLRQRALALAALAVLALLATAAAVIFAARSNANEQTALANEATAAANEALAQTREQEALDTAAELATAEAGALALADDLEVEVALKSTAEAIAGANESVALTREAEALAAEEQAQQERDEAQRQARLAFSRELAGSAMSVLKNDSELALALALESADVTYLQDGTILREAEEALRQTFTANSRIIWSTESTGDFIYTAALHPTDPYIAITDSNLKTTIWDMENDEMVAEISDLWGANYSRDGRHIIGFTFDFGAGVATHITYASLDFSEIARTELAFDFAGATHFYESDTGDLVFRFADGSVTMCVFEAASCQVVGEGYVGQDFYARFSEDESLLLLSSWPGRTTLNAVEHETISLTALVEFDAQVGNVHGADFAEDLSHLVISGQGFVSVWNLPALLADPAAEPLYKHQPLENNSLIENARLTPDLERIFISVLDGRVLALDFQSGAIQLDFTATNGDVTAMRLSSDGSHLVTAGRGPRVRLWDVSDTAEAEVVTLQEPGASFRQAVFSPDDRLVATSNSLGQLYVFDAATGEIYLRNDDLRQAFGLRFSPDGKRLVSAHFDAVLRVWNTATWELERELSGHDPEGVYAPLIRGGWELAISQDNRHMYSSGPDGTARLWDLTTGEQLRVLEHGGFVSDVHLSPDESYVATVSVDLRLTFWDHASGALIASAPLSGEPWGMAFSVDGAEVIVTMRDGTFSVWDTEDVLTGATSEPERLVVGGGGWIFDVQYAPDGSRFMTANTDGTLRFYSTESYELLSIIPAHTQAIFYATYSHDGSRIVSASRDNSVRIFYADVEELLAVARAQQRHTLTEAQCQQYLHRACEPDRNEALSQEKVAALPRDTHSGAGP